MRRITVAVCLLVAGVVWAARSSMADGVPIAVCVGLTMAALACVLVGVGICIAASERIEGVNEPGRMDK